MSSLLSYTLWRAITFPLFYLLVAVLVGTAVLQIKYVNRALQRFDATQVIPVQFVLFTLSVIGGSAVLYRDFERTSGEDAGKFVGGCALTFFGVWLITSGRPRHDDEDDEDREPEPEDAINLVRERYVDEVVDMSEGGTDTRRSSALRASSPPINISARYRDEDDSRPSTPGIKVTPDPTTPQHGENRPATADVMSSLVSNPWTSEDAPSHRTPPFNRHTSTPVLPSEAAPLPPAARSNPELPLPSTPTRGKSQSEVPTTPGSQLRRLRTGDRLPTRNSIAGPLLASPLSTTLSAMVQDMKRGGGSMRRRESVLGIGSSDTAESGVGESLSRRRTRESERIDDPNSAPDIGARARSFSGTLGGLLRGIRGRPSREDVGGEDAEGAQGVGR